ncbi:MULTISPECIES: hypothetical protein [unclassified Lentimicrobium]|uniref:hypothetical protein n=1 Tax=unclassified Lentimicrobium TaxID=2677434 RepID=UPI0015558C80|nr:MULTISPECIES: hypothetical protein [unclassified Lentimicrobium]NPD45276.1 hypothetical protein [Lentimicrobium sp. S6]NPD86226.1 hypothetical protein [Lentimicrobium sp. L6]
MKFIRLIITIVIVFVTSSLHSQSLISKLDTALYSSVGMIKNTLGFDTKAKCSYAVVRILSTSSKRRIDFNISYVHRRCLVENIYADYYLVFNDTVKIIIINDSKLKFEFPLFLQKDDCLCPPGSEFDFGNDRFDFHPVVYSFSSTWLLKKRKLKIDYKYIPFKEIPFNNRPIKTYFGIPGRLTIDTASNPNGDFWIRSLNRVYRLTNGTQMPDSVYNKKINSHFIIELDEQECLFDR